MLSKLILKKNLYPIFLNVKVCLHKNILYFLKIKFYILKTPINFFTVKKKQ